MTFPTSPLNDALHSQFGRSYQYSEENGSWRAAVTPAPEINISTVTAFETATDLPLVNNNPGDTTFVAEDNSFRLWTGSGWFEIALINSSPTITTVSNESYTLATDGTPTVVTLAATDPEGTPIIWAYQVTSGSLGDVTVTGDGNGTFTITPAEVASAFELTFTASDGVNIATSVSSFILVNDPPAAPTGANASYQLSDTRVPTVITLASTDPEGTPIIWSHTLNWGSLEGTTVTNNNNVFTITPGLTKTSFNISFNASDGANTTSSSSTFQLKFGWRQPMYIRTMENPNAYGTGFADQFGHVLAWAGNLSTVVVAAQNEDSASGVAVGKVYLMNASTNTSTVRYTLDNPSTTTQQDDYFGGAVAQSSTTVVVGAPNTDEPNNPSGAQSGRVYVYNLSNGALLRTLNNPNSRHDPTGDKFGSSVGTSGGVVYVGAPGERDQNQTARSGRVYVFSSSGVLTATLENPDASAGRYGDAFGTKIATSDNHLMITAGGEDDPGAIDSGRVYIYSRTGPTLQHTLFNPNPTAGDMFGYAIAIYGNYALVGAPYDDARGEQSGIAYVFNVSTGALVHTWNNPTTGTAEGDTFGWSVALFGEIAIVGAPNASPTNNNCGVIYVYNVVTGELLSTMPHINNTGNAKWGSSVSIVNADFAVVGAMHETGTSGMLAGKVYMIRSGT
jgi:hypothetical protein